MIERIVNETHSARANLQAIHALEPAPNVVRFAQIDEIDSERHAGSANLSGL
jgi:hypothetical protein